ncbi:hypothetical protein VQ02_21605 [Methylobacterium variabile]|uniref:Peptidase metallopeptidase domain-containing protein n=1 Tax=Methylobacterium variabile TaxID=298794 RepID=A0A0J6V2T4_9HYPH|nr:Hint domain-containing protein [Methylobacterium variabile]KMO33151.1 hypothetical protein VQ02_21605 [Methylobacterium variabile]
MATGALNQGATGDQDIDGVLSGLRWNSGSITYNVPTSASYYGANYGGVNNEPSGFQAASASFQSLIRNALAEYAAVANVTFTEVGANDPANISVARTSSLGGFNGYGYYPGSAPVAGDVWFATSTAQVGDVQVVGRGTWRLAMHELGHALGLKHAHETGGPANTAMTTAHDYNDYSLMSYRRTEGGPISGTNQQVDSNPQTPMMYDIAALQRMYGANYASQSGDTVYTWNPTTGQQFVNGVGLTAPGTNRIYRTVWDGGGNDTYDLSNYTTNLRIDLRPGASSTFSTDQLAVTDTTTGTRASGNVFNALQSNGDARSLIENAVGGSGNDTIVGNQANNVLTGGGGANVFRGTAAGHDGDSITDLSNSDVIHVTDAVAAVYGLRYSGTSLSFRLAADSVQTYTIDVSGGTFSGNLLQRPDGAGGVDLFFDGAPVCFTTGTRIRTTRGDVPVERLAVGDRAVTAAGPARPIRWIGRRTLGAAGRPVSPGSWPVRVRQGAFGGGLPARDLLLSPGHPVLVGHEDGQGGVLVPVMCLINGTSVARVAVEEITYWHVELDRHDVLLAEGLPAESYHDMGSRPWFEAGTDDALANPDFVPPGETGRCRPVAVDGPLVEAERRRLDGLWTAWLTAQCAWSAAEEESWLLA